MKNLNNKIPSILRNAGLCLLTFCGINGMMAQDSTHVAAAKPKPEIVKNTFESIWLLDNQTVMVPLRKAFEFDIQHRFGIWSNGYKDMYGFFAPSNIRLGFSYVPIKNLMLGFGICKDKLQWDFSVKYAIVKQTTGCGWPVSITYFGNMVVDTRDVTTYINTTDRFSYFHQLMIARKITKNFALQVAPSLTHYNNVEGYFDLAGDYKRKMENDHFAIACMGRYKLTNTLAIMANYDQPLTQHTANNPHPNLSCGIELGTGGHSFQLFVGNFYNILPQDNNFYNMNDYTKNQFLIGFNITRVWD